MFQILYFCTEQTSALNRYALVDLGPQQYYPAQDLSSSKPVMAGIPPVPWPQLIGLGWAPDSSWVNQFSLPGNWTEVRVFDTVSVNGCVPQRQPTKPCC